MKKYDKKIVYDYINGMDIEDYSIDDLENDKEFMMLVIKITNDKNFYNLCSDNVKKDYDFVKFIIDNFKTNIDFICEVADYYLDNVEDDLMRTEIVAIMTDLTEKSNKEKHCKYKLIGDSIFMTKRVNIEAGIMKLNDKHASGVVRMGFILIFDSYNGNKIVLDFYAKKFIESILEENNIDLESMLHQQFNNPEQINKIGIVNYILNFIGAYDPMLESYLSANIELIKDFSNKIKKIQKNWNKYNNVNEQKKYNLIYSKVHEYMEQVDDDCMLTEIDLLYYIGKKLGIIDKMAKYEINQEFAENIINELDDEFIEDTLNVSFKDRINYHNVKKIITSILFANQSEEPSSDQKENSNHQCQILKLY